MEKYSLAKHVVDVDGLRIGEGYPVRLMGILNLSPESFYKVTITNDKSAIQEFISKMETDGVDIIDIGAASTAPKTVYGTSQVSETTELNRLTSILGDIQNQPIYLYQLILVPQR